MFGFPTEFLLDGLMAILLAATVFYCALLDRRLKALRNGQDGFRETIDQLNTATARAEVSIAQLKQASHSLDDILGTQVQEARALADELTRSVVNGRQAASRSSERSTQWVREALRAVPKNVNGDAAIGANRSDIVADIPRDAPDADLESGLNQTLLDALKRAR